MKKDRTDNDDRGRGPESSGSRPWAGRARLFALLLFALILSPTLFAANDWRPSLFAALMINLGVLVLFYLVITILRLEHFKNMLYDEFGQVAVTVLIVILLIGGMGEAESVGRAAAYAFGYSACPVPPTTGLAPLGDRPYCASLQSDMNTPPAYPAGPAVIWAESVNAAHLRLLSVQMSEAIQFNADLGAASSVSGFCSLMGVGVSIAGCTSYGALRGPTGQLLTATGIGIMETKAEEILLLIADKFALTLLVPLGLILRCLHFTRKAGGTLIALGLSLYLVLPISIIMAQALCDQFVSDPSYVTLPTHALAKGAMPTLKTPDLNSAPGTDQMECDPFDPDEGRLASNSDSILQQLVD